MRRIVAVCCFCEKVRDDTGTQPGEGLWHEFKLYMATHMLRPDEVMLSHGYCPSCFSDYRDFLRLPKEASQELGIERGA